MKLLLFIFMMNLNIIFMNKKMLMIYIYNMLFLMIFLMMMNMNFNMNWMNFYYMFALDKLSLILVMLSIWIISMMFFISKNFSNKKYYSFILLLLLLSLIISFSSINYFMFYLFFEVSIIPTFMLIMGWGYQPERMNASVYMLMYTLLFSLPLLIIIYNLYNYFNSLNYLMILNESVNFKKFNLLFYIFMVMAFMVKLPMFMFHMWLPKAHVEAPVSGSMILAGVMLKLGGYGLMRSLMMMMNLSIKYNNFFMILNLLGVIYLSLICMRQYDLKMLVAYSSIVHMSIMLMGLLSMSFMGFYGGMILMVGHGLCSSGLFMMVNFFYERSKSRMIILNMGMNNLMPKIMIWWFLFCGANMSMPITLNLMGELMIMMSLINWLNNYYIMLLMTGMFFSSIYSLYLFSLLYYGKLIKFNKNFMSNTKIMEFLSIIAHWIPLNFFILKINIFM
nr:NADH dehydrogenase subunit 4 [Sycophaga agraensis]